MNARRILNGLDRRHLERRVHGTLFAEVEWLGGVESVLAGSSGYGLAVEVTLESVARDFVVEVIERATWAQIAVDALRVRVECDLHRGAGTEGLRVVLQIESEGNANVNSTILSDADREAVVVGIIRRPLPVSVTTVIAPREEQTVPARQRGATVLPDDGTQAVGGKE